MSVLGKRTRASPAAEYFSSAHDQADKLTYQPISQIDQSIRPPIKQQSTSSIPAFLTEILPTSALSSVASKLSNKFVTLTPTPSVKHQYNKTVKQPKRQITTGMSARQRKESGLFDIQSNNQTIKYESLLPLHHLWSSYMSDLLTDQSLQSVPVANKLIKADLHGAIITVSRCTTPSMIGITGICVQETQEMFRLIDQSNKLKNVPKKGAIFTVKLSADQSVELFGSQLRVRASERAAKKFKNKPNCRI